MILIQLSTLIFMFPVSVLNSKFQIKLFGFQSDNMNFSYKNPNKFIWKSGLRTETENIENLSGKLDWY